MLKHFDRESMIWGADIPANEKLFLLALNSFVDANGECYPGLELLARMTGFTERTCRTIRDRLKDKGIITTGRRYNSQGFRSSDRYRIDFDSIKSLPERISTGNLNLPEIDASLPEIDDTPTGNPLQSLPEEFSRDLSSRNYPERTVQVEESAEVPRVNLVQSDIQRFEASFASSALPWILKAHRYNPEIDARMLAGVKAHLGKYEQPNDLVDVKRWILAADESSPKGVKRMTDACLIWESVTETPATLPQSPTDIAELARQAIAQERAS